MAFNSTKPQEQPPTRTIDGEEYVPASWASTQIRIYRGACKEMHTALEKCRELAKTEDVFPRARVLTVVNRCLGK